MTTFGIIGYPLTHSFSKQYFTEKIEREDIPNAIYNTFPLNLIEDFPALLRNNPSLRGLSVTIPYKEQVLKYIDNLSDEVTEIGATNCIRIRDGVLKAFNTDVVGFEQTFVKQLKANHTKALILGTGGASKAVQYVLNKLSIEFLVVSRKEFSTENFIRYQQVTESLVGEYNIVINTTPLGMSPDEETCPDIPYKFLTAEHYLYDLVYKPAKTLFLTKGEEQGALIYNGFEMLTIQAEENWRIWNEE